MAESTMQNFVITLKDPLKTNLFNKTTKMKRKRITEAEKD
jgi:hypothetical protein